MKPQKFRLVIVWLLVAAICISLLPLNLPAGFAFAGQTQAPSRRSKNGGATTAPQSPGQPAESQNDKSSTRSDSGKTDQNTTTTDRKTAKEADNSTDDAFKTAPDSGEKEDQANRASRKREPLPFDRPPVASQPPQQNKPADDTDRQGTASQKPSTDRPTSATRPPQSQKENSNGSNRPGVSVQTPTSQNPSTTTAPQRYPSTTDPDTNSTGRTSPPVLKRGEDLPNSNSNTTPSDRQRGAPPVLQRPGQEQPNPVWKQSPNGQDSTSSNGGTPSTAPRTPGGAPTTGQTGEEEVVKLESTMVSIPILVSDRSNRYVPQLNKRDFLLYEDGTQQEIAYFGNEEVPFSVALVLDFSPSVAGSQDAIQDAAIDFIRQLRPQDRVMVVSFARNVDFLTDFTNDRYALERAIRSTSTENGTSVYEAVYRVVERMRNVDGRKALILFSDGEDTTSRHTSYNDAISALTEADILAYGLRYPANGGGGGGGGGGVHPWPRNIPNIGLPIPLPFPFPFPRRRRGPFMPMPNYTSPSAGTQFPRRGGNGSGDFMADVANAGGGSVYDALQVGDMRGLANKIAEELRHVYVVSYYPSNPLSNGGYRTIRIRVKNRDDIAVRHRRGYYAKDNHQGSKV
jgi:VWFA-related protein